MFFFSNLFFTVCNEYFRPSSLASNWLFLHMHLILNRWSFLLLLWEIKSHHLKLCWTCQPKSVSPPAATSNSLCPPVTGEVTFCFPLSPTPLQEPCCLLLSLLFSFIFIHFRSLPPQPHPFPSCSLSLINLFRYVPSLSCTPLKPSPPSHLAAQRLESISSITVILTLTPPSCLTSLSPISMYHSTDQLLRVAAAAALGPVGHECLLEALLHTLSRLLLFLGHLPLVSFFGLSPPSDL